MLKISNKNLAKSSILIIGGTGFIGSHLSMRLLELGAVVTSISLRKKRRHFDNRIKYFYLDLTNKKKLENYFKKNSFDYIFNLGGYVNHKKFSEGGSSVIDEHFLNIIYQFKNIDKNKLKRYVFIGSADEYPILQSPKKLSESTLCSPRSPYSFAKHSTINFLQMLYRSEGWPISIARIFLTYGPGQGVNRLIPNIINHGIKFGVVNTTNGSQVRDFCYIDDVIDGLISIVINKKAIGEIFNIASGKAVSVKNVIKILSNRIGCKINFGVIKKRKDEPEYQVANISLSKKILNWSPKINLEDGLKKTIDYYL
tara:strand:+ start:28430 stop:29365 length:936 start_codon:yes stop_codon:yes gene_type:complete